jgi:hypothetical protein
MLLENLERVERGEDPIGVLRDPAKNEPHPEEAFPMTSELTACARCVFRRACGRDQPVEARGMVDEGRVAAPAHIVDDRPRRRLDVLGGLALGQKERGEARLEIGIGLVQPVRHAPAPRPGQPVLARSAASS